MRRFMSTTLALAVVTSCGMAIAAPAFAARHRHHRHHRAHGANTCGPGTVNSGGVCVPAGGGPEGSGNVKIDPSDVTMTLDGLFASSAVVSGLPPLTTVASNSPITCGPAGAAIVVLPTKGIAADGAGRAQVSVTNATGRVGTPGCVPGTYPLTFTETSSPFQTFTGFIILHF